MSSREREHRLLGMEASMTRRDFVNGTVAGAVALSANLPAAMPQALDRDWTGPGGIGDYRFANGNTHEVVNAAHSIRDGAFSTLMASAETEDQVVDLVIVGGGITGLICAWEFSHRTGRSKTCLVLDNHRMFGGEAKGNEFEVAGYRISGPQGSNATIVPQSGLLKAYWDALQIPVAYEFQEPTGTHTPIRVSKDHYGPMFYTAESTSLGYWFRNEAAKRGGEWHRDIWNDNLAKAPLNADLKADLLRWRHTEEVKLAPGMKPLPAASDPLAWRAATENSDVARWLDSMSYADYIEKVMGLSAGVSRHIDPLIATGLSGTACDAVSAYAAQRLSFPGVAPQSMSAWYEKAGIFSSPIGNGFIARYFVKTLIPDAMAGGHSLSEVIGNPVNLRALDRPGSPVRIRLGSTAARVEHEGSPQSADIVRITYVREGKPFVVRARNVIMASGGWMNQHVVRDLPEEIRESYANFFNGPVLTANIALNNWRFMDKLGISGARWFDGLGYFGNFIQPMKLDGKAPPLDPAKPIVLTSYIPFLNPGLPGRAQATLGRSQLLAPSFADFELRIRQQLQSMFTEQGFDARRDIAGLVLNRWGHAYICPYPGFFFGKDGRPAARDAVRKGYGRIGFAHAELQGNQSWVSSALEAKRASDQLAARS